MSTFLSGIFSWLNDTATGFLAAFWEVFGKVRWTLVAFLGFVLMAFNQALGMMVYGTAQLVQVTAALQSQVSEIVNSANSAAGAVSGALGLANCIMPISEGLAACAVLFATWLIFLSVRVVLALYRLIPLKFT